VRPTCCAQFCAAEASSGSIDCDEALLLVAAAAAAAACPAGADRSFVTFILEPLYKLTSAVVGEHPKTIERLLGDEFGIHLKSSAYSQDVKPLLKEVRP
jgi:hypothetical protein